MIENEEWSIECRIAEATLKIHSQIDKVNKMENKLRIEHRILGEGWTELQKLKQMLSDLQNKKVKTQPIENTDHQFV